MYNVVGIKNIITKADKKKMKIISAVKEADKKEEGLEASVFFVSEDSPAYEVIIVFGNYDIFFDDKKRVVFAKLVK